VVRATHLDPFDLARRDEGRLSDTNVSAGQEKTSHPRVVALKSQFHPIGQGIDLRKHLRSRQIDMTIVRRPKDLKFLRRLALVSENVYRKSSVDVLSAGEDVPVVKNSTRPGTIQSLSRLDETIRQPGSNLF
jgi:hypothetical protein